MTSFSARHLSLFFLLFLFANTGPLALAAPSLKIESLPKKIALGERATLRVQLEWAPGDGPYEINSLEPKLENLALETQHQSQETGRTILHTITYEFRPLKTGAAVIYPFEISYRRTEADPWIPLFIPEQKSTIVSGLPIKALGTWFGALVLFVGIGFAGFIFWKRAGTRKTAKDLPPPDPKQRIYAKAEEAISIFSSPDAKEKLTYWSNQLRTVIVTYYDIPSKTATSAEVLDYLRSKGLPAGEWQEISRLFETLSEMQFSRQDIPSYDLERTQKTLLQYVKGKIIIGKLDS